MDLRRRFFFLYLSIPVRFFMDRRRYVSGFANGANDFNFKNEINRNSVLTSTGAHGRNALSDSKYDSKIRKKNKKMSFGLRDDGADKMESDNAYLFGDKPRD